MSTRQTILRVPRTGLSWLWAMHVSRFATRINEETAARPCPSIQGRGQRERLPALIHQ